MVSSLNLAQFKCEIVCGVMETLEHRGDDLLLPLNNEISSSHFTKMKPKYPRYGHRHLVILMSFGARDHSWSHGIE